MKRFLARLGNRATRIAIRLMGPLSLKARQEKPDNEQPSPSLDVITERSILDLEPPADLKLVRLDDADKVVVPESPIFGTNQLNPNYSRRGFPRFLASIDRVYVEGSLCAAFKPLGNRTFHYIRESSDMSLDQGDHFAKLFPSQGENRTSAVPLLPTVFTDEAVLAGHRHTNNYFHFIVEGIPRILLADSILGRDKTKVVFGNLGESQRALLKMLWPDRHFLCLQYGDVLEANRLHIARVSSYSPFSVEEARWSVYDEDMLRALRQRIVPLLISTWSKPANTVFLSRRKLSEFPGSFLPNRQLRNEDEVLEHLSLIEPDVIYPERLAMDAQMQEIAAASLVVMQAGSAVANLIFLRPGSVAIILCHSNAASIGYFDIMARICDVRLAYVACEPDNPDDVHSSITARIEDLDAALRWARE
jgi:capsular polysaccharide biosynthesis protein